MKNSGLPFGILALLVPLALLSCDDPQQGTEQSANSSEPDSTKPDSTKADSDTQSPQTASSDLANPQASADSTSQEEPGASWQKRGERLKEIAAAVNKHYDDERRFPTYAPPGAAFFERPNLSWRVWILPQLGEQELFDQFKQDEPWDSEHNKALIEKMPKSFALPSLETLAEPKPGHTTIQALSGDGAILESEKPGMPPSKQAILDGEANTALLMECHPSKATPWTKPDDFGFDPAAEADVARFGIDGEEFFLIITVSGEIRRIRKDAEVRQIDRLFQRDDQRETAWNEIEFKEEDDQ